LFVVKQHPNEPTDHSKHKQRIEDEVLASFPDHFDGNSEVADRYHEPTRPPMLPPPPGKGLIKVPDYSPTKVRRKTKISRDVLSDPPIEGDRRNSQGDAAVPQKTAASGIAL
jgi:hypothetical protein